MMIVVFFIFPSGPLAMVRFVNGRLLTSLKGPLNRSFIFLCKCVIGYSFLANSLLQPIFLFCNEFLTILRLPFLYTLYESTREAVSQSVCLSPDVYCMRENTSSTEGADLPARAQVVAFGRAAGR